MQLTIKTWTPQGTAPAEHAHTVAAARDALLAEGIAWVDVLDPSPADFAPLASELGLSPLAVEDALTVHERPKSVRYGDTVFIAANTVADTGTMHRISLFFLDGGVLSIRLGEGFDIAAAAETITENHELLRCGPHALELMVLDSVVDGYSERVAVLDEQVDDLESGLFESTNRDEIAQQTFTLHKEVAELRRVVLPMRDVASSLLRRVSADATQHDLLPYAEDVYDHTMRAVDWTENLREGVESVRATNLALVDNQMNVVMKKLTSWAAIIAVPTAITGYFGQNVPYPGFAQQWGFWLSSMVMIVVATTLYLAFRKRGWL